MCIMYNALNQLPAGFAHLKQQLEYPLFTVASTGNSTYDPDYISFSFDPDIYRDFENRRVQDYMISNIKVSNIDKRIFDYSILVAADVICGYSLKGYDQSVIDLNSVDASAYTKVYYPNADFDKLATLLNADNIKEINPSEVYEVVLNGSTYYHIKDLEDGDFIGISTDKVIYTITHDPFEIVPMNESLKELFNDNKLDQ
ncbi:hypothetical protein SAMN05428947_11095 [Mucilaginibacter sp. OK283]|nr:hypothetical protein SAMN05428947_11095 [Mucilaginibacter sp. OK283]